jgi:hypothetical protein
MDTATERKYASMDDLESLRSDNVAAKYRVSTLEEYHAAQTSHESNRASEQIEAGREPSLVSLFGVEFGMHPYVEIYDVMIEKQGNLIGLDIPGAREVVYLDPNTLLTWSA